MAVSTIPQYTMTTGDTVILGSSSTIMIQLVKYGNVVYGTIVDGSSGSRGAGTHIGTLPTGYLPKVQCDFIDTYGKKRCLVKTDGTVTVEETTSTHIRGSFCFITP